jgi:hypothetical protein
LDLPKFSKFQVVIFTWLDASCIKNKKNNKRLFIKYNLDLKVKRVCTARPHEGLRRYPFVQRSGAKDKAESPTAKALNG